MKGTRIKLLAVFAALLTVLSLCLCSCEQIIDALVSAAEGYGSALESSQEEETSSGSGIQNETAEEPSYIYSESYPDEDSDPWGEDDEDESSAPEPVSEPEPEPAIPFTAAPDIPEYTLPAETFPDQLEREASEIIDRAICRAIAVVSVYKDDRHSDDSYAFDYDANGFVKELNDDQESLYRAFIAYAGKFKDFEITQSDYNGDLISDVLTISKPLSLTRPDIDSYFSFTPSGTFSSVQSSYFDPYRDANYSVKDGDTDKESVRHAIKLLQRIVKRVVAKMPEGLSTYDKYLYLATVVAEQNHYDSTPDNCFTPFGALVCGKSVCEGYTRAFLLLCREADLWCAYRFGMPKGGGHIWNMIKLDTGIYNVDITWSDNYETGSKKWFKYFIKSDSDFVTDGHNANDGVKGTGAFEPDPFQSSR